MTREEFAKRVNVSRETLDALSLFVTMLEKWQKRINLISPATMPEVWYRHVFDSAQLVSYMPKISSDATRCIMDIGSGAGFPGLILSILEAGELKLVESDERKAAFLETVIRELGLSAVVINKRVESLPPFKPDVITARALAPLPKLMSLIDTQLHAGLTCLFLKGTSVEEELTNFQTYSNMMPHLYQSLTCGDGVIVKLTTPG